MTTTGLTSQEAVHTGNDAIVIVKNLETIRGGRTLDVTGFDATVLHAGHVIIEATDSGVYKPLPLDNLLPSGHAYKGVLVATILVSRPLAAIMVRGTVNKAAMELGVSDDAIAALPLIRFVED